MGKIVKADGSFGFPQDELIEYKEFTTNYHSSIQLDSKSFIYASFVRNKGLW